LNGFALPSTPQSVATLKPDPRSARVYLMGLPKVGKTTMAGAWMPDRTLFLDLQHGTDLLTGEHYVSHIDTWTEFEQACDKFAAGQHRFQTIVIDTIDMAYKLADAHVGTLRGHAAAGLVEYGKGTAEAEGLFRKAISKLLACRGLGVWFVGHAVLIEVDKKQKYVPALDKRVQLYITGEAEHIFIAEKIGTRSVLHTQASQRHEAGSRLPLPATLDMDARGLYAAMQTGINQLVSSAAPQPPADTNGKATE
jgi:hypothetical protein